MVRALTALRFTAMHFTLRRLTAAGSVVAVAVSASLSGQDTVIPHRQDRVPNRPYSPDEAVARMVVPEGFRVELVAAEPDLVNPVAMAFDDRGRIWVTESLEYPRKPAGEGRDRIKILEDRDGDGRAETVSVFAEGLNIPSGIETGYGGVWVLNAPDLLFMRESDGRAASREVVVTGFGRTDTHELPNSLTWGPDGWLYGLNGVFNRSRVTQGEHVFEFTCALFRVHPRTREFQIVCEGTSNPWGLVWDPEGSAIVSACHWAKDHIFHFVETAYYQRQAGAYPAFTWRVGSVSDHGHQKTAYCGLAYLDSDAYPEAYRGKLYMGNVHGGCINVDVLERAGSTYVSRAAPDFLTANDVWFMPVSQAVGPDGCLYVLDWYDRYHCYQDANRDPEGIDRERGRLYRIRYGDSPRAPAFDLGRESDEALVARLDSPNIFFRERAQRVLAERGGAAVLERLEKLVRDPQASRRARLHALWSRIGAGPLEEKLHRTLLLHADPTVRAWAVRAAGNAGQVTPAIRDAVAALAFDAAPEVGLQVAIAAPKLDGLDALPVLTHVLASCGEDRLVPSVVWPNVHPLLAARTREFADLVSAAPLDRSQALARVLPRVTERLLATPAPDASAVAAIVETLARHDSELAREAVGAIASRLPELSAGAVSDLTAALRPLVERVLDGAAIVSQDASASPSLVVPVRLLGAQLGLVELEAQSLRETFLEARAPESERLQALDALVLGADAASPRAALLDAIDGALPSCGASLAAGVLAALGRLDDPAVARVVLRRFAELDVAAKPLAVDLLLQRRSWSRDLLAAVMDGTLPADTLNANHLRQILAGNDRESIWAIEKRWGHVRTERDPAREQVVAELDALLHDTRGDPRAGRDVFAGLCAQCHVIWGEGSAVGPDLSTNGRGSFRQLVSNILDPNLVIGPGYETTTVVTTDGRVLVGLVVEDTDARVTLAVQGGRRETVPRASVKYARATKLSLMPEGLEETLSRKELADLIAFLALDGPPASPPPRAIPGAPAWVEEAARAAAAEN